MKRFFLPFFLLIISLCPNISFANKIAKEMLHKMYVASKQLSYELDFITINEQGINSLRYRHAFIHHQEVAQLLQQDGAKRAVLLHDGIVSYYSEGTVPFSLKRDALVDSLPSILSINAQAIAPIYDFILVGHMRISNRNCQGIHIVSRDGTRYSYIIWLDEKTYLPMRVDLINRYGDYLEQFRVIGMRNSSSIKKQLSSLLNQNFPALITLPSTPNIDMPWRIGWLPQGAHKVFCSQDDLFAQQGKMDSCLFTDGLFTFTVDVLRLPKKNVSYSRFLQKGSKSIYYERRGKYEIAVVGELPEQTAKRIANSVYWE